MKNQESGELELALNLISIQLLNLVGMLVLIERLFHDTHPVH